MVSGFAEEISAETVTPVHGGLSCNSENLKERKTKTRKKSYRKAREEKLRKRKRGEGGGRGRDPALLPGRATGSGGETSQEEVEMFST
jgi:hypothetical protein